MRHLAPMLAGLLLVACSGKSSPPPAPNPPVVEVIPASTVVVGTEVKVDVQVTGCDSVTSVVLDDHDLQLASAENPQPRSSYTLAKTQVPYKQDGIAATLALRATAKCANGTSATSPAENVLFMPADTVFPGAFPTTTLSLDPDGTGLVTCNAKAVTRFATDGSVKQSSGLQLGFDCTGSGYALRGRPGELYWIEPGNTFAWLSNNLASAVPYNYQPGTVYLPASSTGPAVVFNATAQSMIWVDRGTGQLAYPNELLLGAGTGIGGAGATLAGTPGFGSLGLSVPEVADDPSGSTVNLQVERFNTNGQSAGMTVAAQVSKNDLGLASVPLFNLSEDGSLGYFIVGADSNELWVCDVVKSQPCAASTSGGGLAFTETLTGGPFTIAANIGNVLAVAGPNAVVFLKSNTGQQIGQTIAPSGGLQVLQIRAGAGSQVYVLAGDPLGHLLEVILLTEPGVEAARFHINAGDMGFDLDQQGVPYLLTDHLARLLTPDQYLLAKQ